MASREQDCGEVHTSIDEAIAHAKQNMGGSLPEPMWGMRGGKIANIGWVIGYQSADGRRRYRLDFAPGKGAHVNEEDYTRPPNQQKVVHLVRPSHGFLNAAAEQAWERLCEARMLDYWRKWTSRYNKPATVLEAERATDQR